MLGMAWIKAGGRIFHNFDRATGQPGVGLLLPGQPQARAAVVAAGSISTRAGSGSIETRFPPRNAAETSGTRLRAATMRACPWACGPPRGIKTRGFSTERFPF